MLFMFFTSRFLGFACGNQHTDQQDQQHGQRHNGRNNNGFNFKRFGGNAEVLVLIRGLYAAAAYQQAVGVDAVGVQVIRVT